LSRANKSFLKFIRINDFKILVVKNKVFLFGFLLLSVFAFSQAKSGGEKTAKEYFISGNELRKSGNQEQARENYLKAEEIYKNKKDISGLCNVYSALGNSYYSTGDYEKAIRYFDLHYKNALINNSSEDKYLAQINLGAVFYDLSEYEKAMGYFVNAAEICENKKDKNLSFAYTSIGNVCYAMKKYDEAIVYYKKSIDIDQKINNTAGLAKSLNNMGSVYQSFEWPDVALKYFRLSLENEKKIKNEEGIAESCNNIAGILMHQEKYDEAAEMLDQAEEINLKLKDSLSLAWTYLKKGELNKLLVNEDQAQAYFEKSLEICKNKSLLSLKQENYFQLASSAELKGEFRDAYKYYKMALEIGDSIFDQNTELQITTLQVKYETDKKIKEIELLNSRKEIDDLKLSQLKEKNLKTNMILTSVSIVLGIIFLLAMLLYYQFRTKQKLNKKLLSIKAEIIQQKEEIEAQRDEIEAQRNNIELQKNIATEQKEKIEAQKQYITSGIEYAARIQNAMMPPVEILKKYFPDSFIFYHPKDIVSGDFFWFHNDNRTMVVAAADCTGHGVPGGSMSMLGLTYLSDVVSGENEKSPDLILNKLRAKVIEILKQKSAAESGLSVKDGMDMSVVSIDLDSKILLYAGANNPVWIIRAKTGELIELNPDKCPVGIHYLDEYKPFNLAKIQCEQDDCIFLFSDGLADQFGGPKGKKFKYQSFKNVLIENHTKSMLQQKQKLEEAINGWMNFPDHSGNPHQQIDDILVIGIKIT